MLSRNDLSTPPPLPPGRGGGGGGGGGGGSFRCASLTTLPLGLNYSDRPTEGESQYRKTNCWKIREN